MQTRSVTKELSGGLSRSWQMMLRLLGVAVVGSLSLLAVVGLVGHPVAVASLGTQSRLLSGSLDPSAYLYHLDGGVFLTISLPSGSRPADVSVVSGTLADRIWFSEPGLGRIGQVVYTSSIDYALTEYNVGGSPTSLAASNMDVWFTLPAQNQVGHLDVASGGVTLVNLPSAQAGLADIAIDANGRAWATERAANRLALVTISPTVGITEYVLPASGLMPEGVVLDGDGNVWFAASATGTLWRLAPAINEYLVLPPLGSTSYPYRIALDNSNHIWATLQNIDQLARVSLGTLPLSTTYTIPTSNSRPGAIAIDSLGQVYFAEQAAAQIGQLVVTSTASFAEYPLPQSGLKLTGLAVAGDDSVWAIAYHDIYQVYLPLVMQNYNSTPPPLAVQIYLPLVMQNYNSTPPPLAIQMYGSVNATNGFTWAVASGAGWIRFPVCWACIEPVNTSSANYNWGDLDSSVQTAAAAGKQLILTIDKNPGWAAASSCGPVTNTADLQQFVGALVARYPQVTYWEFYNEPDRARVCFGLNGAGYAAILESVYPIVKAANPSANVVMGGLAMDWFQQEGGPFDSGFLTEVVSSCVGSCFDVANFHYYPGFRSQWEPYGHDIIGKANFIRQVLAANGYSRPLINTEMGWPAGTTTGSPELAARYVPKVNARARAAGLVVANWYSLLDSDTSLPGLLDSTSVIGSLSPRPSFFATQTFVKLLGYASYTRAIPSSETGSAQIEGYQFTVAASSGSKRMDIYWYECPSMSSIVPTDCSSTASLQINAPRIGKIDKLGNEVILNDGDDGTVDGRVTIPGGVASSPIYIDYQP